MRKITLFAAAWVFTPTFACADSATVASGAKTELTTHMRYDKQCQPSRVEIKILAPPANGTVTSGPKSIVVAATSARGVPQNPRCVGKTVDGIAVYYQSKPGFVGQDSFRYFRFNPNDSKDRFNAEISYTIKVQSAPAASAQSSVKAVFEKHNLLGTFAQDCSKPASQANPYLTNRALDAGHVQRDRMIGPTTRQWAAILDKAAESKPNEIAASGTRDGQPWEIVWQVERGRMRGLESTIGGRKEISAGRFVPSGVEAAWFQRCGQ